ncbi:MAG: serine/threonine protein kinase [Planctomycetes bacterium]|nr:serine/threonine protein kinase [Planctomycetota bacterium]
MSHPGPELDALRQRLDDDLSAGKTVVLGVAELDDPEVRRRLPQLLEQLAASHDRQSLSPLRLPGYVLLGEIARGGMSTVHLARHEALQRTVAVKITPNWLASDASSRRRLVAEARALALVNHPNVVHVYDVIDTEAAFAIAMEWVDGDTLARLVRALPAMPSLADMQVIRDRLGAPEQPSPTLEATPMRTFVHMMRDIALATQAVHDAGLLHLDIKPSNVLVRRDGTALLADFGVVREVGTDQTHTRTFAGTPIYAAPEQLRRVDAQISWHTDVYAIGLTLYELLAREQPLRDLDLASIAKTVESGHFPPLARFVEVPADLANIVQMAIAPEPANRYPSAAALAADLSAFLEGRPVTARPLSRTQRMRRWVRSEPWKATLAGALLVLVPVLLGLGGYLAWQWPQLERIRIEERHAEARRLKNEAFQSELIGFGDELENDRLLARAAELEDGGTAIACRLLMLNQRRVRDMPDHLARYEHQIADSKALRLFARLCAEERAFFTDDEVAELQSSPDPLDHYVLAIERVLLANDTYIFTHRRQAADCIAHALLSNGPDELLHGLLVWSAYGTHEPHRIEVAHNAIVRLWPDDVAALTWVAGAQLHAQSPDTDATLRRLEELAPDSLGWHFLRTRQAARSGNWRDVAARAEAAMRAGATSVGTRGMALRAASQTWAAPLFCQLGELFPAHMPCYPTLHATLATAPRLARGLAQRVLDRNPTPEQLFSLHAAATDMGHEGIAHLLEDYLLREMPDRRRMDPYLMHRFGAAFADRRASQEDREHSSATVSAAARRWRANEGEAYLLPTQMRMLATVRDWPALDSAARDWFAASEGDDHLQAAGFVALAESRMGNDLVAAEFSAIALCAKSRKTWWINAWLEDAWLHVDPNGPTELRDPARAMEHMQRFQEHNDPRRIRLPFRGPWINGIQAHVYLANGDKESARRLFEAGRVALSSGKLEPASPEAEWVAARYDWLEAQLR